jgi:hypothetical protein
MSLHRRAPRRDENEPEVVEAFRRLGAHVQALSAKGVPDLLVHFKGRWQVVEVKRPKEKLTPDQESWWAARGEDPVIARYPGDAYRILERMMLPIVQFEPEIRESLEEAEGKL